LENPRVLIIDDSAEVSDFLRRGLIEENYQVTVAQSGEVGLRRADEGWELIILDLMLPDISGESILEYITHRTDHPPVLVLTARDQLGDKLSLFRLGCDDYLTKPFAFEELLERVKALMRRAPKASNVDYHYEDMTLEPQTNLLTVGSFKTKISLTPKEFAICRTLIRQPGQVVSRKQLLHSVWGLRHEPKTNFIEVHFANLRKKLIPVKRENWVRTVRTSGFVLSRPEDHAS
jgi:two-component system OmpR family response regulator